MWKAFLPLEITLVLKPTADPEEGTIKLSYRISISLFKWIALKVLAYMGSIDLNGLTLTPSTLVIRLPDLGIPYRVEEIRDGEFIIKLKKE